MLKASGQELLDNDLLGWTTDERKCWISERFKEFNIMFDFDRYKTYIIQPYTGETLCTLDTDFDEFKKIFMEEKFEHLYYVRAIDFTEYMEDFLESIFQCKETQKYIKLNKDGSFTWLKHRQILDELCEWERIQQSKPGITLKKDAGQLVANILAGNTYYHTPEEVFNGATPEPWRFGLDPSFSRDYNMMWRIAAVNFLLETDICPPINLQLGWYDTIHIIKEPKGNDMYYRVELGANSTEVSFQYSEDDLKKVIRELEYFLELPWGALCCCHDEEEEEEV